MASMSAALFGGALVLTVSLQAGLAAQPVAALAGTPAAQALLLVPHRAVYDLSLDEKRGNSTVEGARGRIVYDFKGSRCEGYSLQFRQVTEMMANGATNTSDMRTTSFEDDAGEVFRFNVENFTNRHLDSEVEGQAERSGTSISVELKKPSSETVTLSEKVVFPTAQIKGILQRAQKGESLYESDIYDGSDARKVYSTLAVIGHRQKGAKAAQGAGGKMFKDLESVDRWPVTVSYFDPAKAGPGEQTPVYSLSFDLYANGISDDLKLDYGDFALRGRMVSLEMHQPKSCEPGKP